MVRREVVVLQSFPEPRPTTNPYIVMLRDALRSTAGVRVQTFSWRHALLGRFDVFHAHWPENLVNGASPVKARVRQLLFAVFLLRLRARHIAVVRTQHNLELPSGLDGLQRALLRRFDSMTAMRIALNDSTRFSEKRSFVTIPHGHYRDWFGTQKIESARPGRLAYFGLIRRYKNTEALARAFTDMPGPYELQIAGNPSSADLAAALRAIAAEDERIDLRLGFQTDAELVAVASAAELVVLPYTHMHNSGGVLTALSLNRPVLVPATEVNDRLSHEVGAGWVHQYRGPITAPRILEVLDRIRSEPAVGVPDLSRREWSETGLAHLGAYREALRLVGATEGRPYSR